MAGMDHDGHWYRYLAARHDTAFYISVVVIAAALMSVVSGKTIVKYQGLVSRTDDPKTFWRAVIVLFLLGMAFLGLYTFGPS